MYNIVSSGVPGGWWWYALWYAPCHHHPITPGTTTTITTTVSTTATAWHATVSEFTRLLLVTRELEKTCSFWYPQKPLKSDKNTKITVFLVLIACSQTPNCLKMSQNAKFHEKSSKFSKFHDFLEKWSKKFPKSGYFHDFSLQTLGAGNLIFPMKPSDSKNRHR